MKTVEELQKELEKAKKEELFKKWETYLTNLKAELEKLRGKTICAWISNGTFALYQIKDIKEQYYLDREGFHGQWSPKRWIEITTYGYILCSVADDRGKWYNPKIEQYDNYRTFKFKTFSKKDKTIEVSKVVYHDDEYSFGEIEY
jgi:hypothetical protein